jgi:hypothetical protein
MAYPLIYRPFFLLHPLSVYRLKTSLLLIDLQSTFLRNTQNPDFYICYCAPVKATSWAVLGSQLIVVFG